MSTFMSGYAYKITTHTQATGQKRFFVVIAKNATAAIEAASEQVVGQCTELTLIDGTVLLADNIQIKGFLQ